MIATQAFQGVSLGLLGVSPIELAASAENRVVLGNCPMADSQRYRLDFAVPSSHDIAEPDDFARNPTLDLIRASLAADPRWDRSMLAP